MFRHLISRLSIKHFGVSRSVSPNTWHRILSRSTSTNTNTSTSLLFRGYPIDYPISNLYLLQHENDDNFHNGVFVDLDTPSDNYAIFDLVGSCNGLVCLCERAYYSPACVGNPITREYVWLPRSGKQTEYDVVSGFGFDQVANQYKVIRMMYDMVDSSLYDYQNDIFRYVKDGIIVPFRLEAKIHTIGSDKEWRRLGNLPYPLKRLEQPPVFANGALHFTIDDGIAMASTNLTERIVAFDLAKEEFQLIPSPPGFISYGYNPCGYSLVELGGYLSYYCSFPDRCEIWVMKEYGHKGSWFKEYIIPRQVEGFGNMDFSPLTLMKNGNILLRVNGRALACYDPTRKSFHKLEIPDIPDDKTTMITHDRSSISLKSIVGPTNRFFICGKDSSVNTGRWTG